LNTSNLEIRFRIIKKEKKRKEKKKSREKKERLLL